LDSEVVGERVDEQDDLARSAVRRCPTRDASQIVALPAREPPPWREAEEPLQQRSRTENTFAQIRERAHAGDVRRVARQEGDDPLPEGQAVASPIRGERFDLEPRHIHPRRTFALAALARDAQLERRVHRLAGEIFVAELAAEGESQRIGPPTRGVLLIARDAIARAHRAGVALAAMPVVAARL